MFYFITSHEANYINHKLPRLYKAKSLVYGKSSRALVTDMLGFKACYFLRQINLSTFQFLACVACSYFLPSENVVMIK